MLKLFLIGFFILHFGGFVFVLFLGLLSFLPAGTTAAGLESLLQGLLIPLFGFLVSHGVSFKLDYLDKKPQLRLPIEILMFSPYPRVLALIFIIVVGKASGVPVLGLVLLKTVFDLAWFAWGHYPKEEYLNIPIENQS